MSSPAELATRIIGRNLSLVGSMVVVSQTETTIRIRIGRKHYVLTIEEEGASE